MFKSHEIKWNLRVLRKNKVDTYGAHVFVPDYRATILAGKMCTNSLLCILYFYDWIIQNYILIQGLVLGLRGLHPRASHVKLG